MDPKSSKLFQGDCKGRTICHVTMIMDLSRDIMSEILSRLLIKSIFRCKTVCKLWYNLLTSDPLFLNMYHKRSSSKFPSLLLSINLSVRLLVELKADDSHPLKRAIVLSPRFHLPSPNLRLIGSCNGFMCLLNGWRYDLDHSIYISNPLLGEYFEVKLLEWEKRIQRVAYAFCFSEASGQYKVLRSVVRKFDGPQVSELNVYTLGVDEKWRYVGQAPVPLRESFSNANVNGVVHWMNCRKNDSIYSFNSWTEEVKSFLAPRCLEISSHLLTLVELRNCLCLCNSNHSEYVDIWWMKEYGIAESWTKDRILKDSIQPDIRCDRFIPISTWKDGEILMRRDKGTHVVSYNPKENKFDKVRVYGGFSATSYMPSFYSLKTVIGENFQVSYAYPKIKIV
ncbi:F-box protein At3g07870-like [Solanum dulcamara]|uniref:F-box protein At3g07870-like n=1 Tax=Solanum dulcamara TaxID=45834 RepID=UPI00248585B2|nr:F-box protein At3g07870-like [Solanum dulcamara]